MLIFELSETLTVFQNAGEIEWSVQAAQPICAAVVHSQTTQIRANC